MSKIHKLFRKQVVKTDIDTAWKFLCSPKNLKLLTPENLDFKIVTDLPDTMYDGLLIEFRVGVPPLGKQTWLSEIKNIREKHSFVDEQRLGPYKLWNHRHEVQPVEGGVCFIDEIHYALPLGLVGTFAHLFYVKKMLKYIFDYRQGKLSELLE